MLQEEFGILKQNEWKSFWTDGQWSHHQLLEYILEQTGPAEVMLSTFTICEASVRSLYNLCESGQITKLKCLFDTRTRKNKADILLFAAGITPAIYISDCHAKLVIISNDKWKIAIIGSANFSINSRLECGIICSVTDVFDFFKTNLETAMNTAVPFTLD